MTEIKEELFDVVIYEISTRKIDSVIGKNMRRHDGTGSGRNTADMRVQTGRECCHGKYDATMVPAAKFKEGSVLPEGDNSP